MGRLHAQLHARAAAAGGAAPTAYPVANVTADALPPTDSSVSTVSSDFSSIDLSSLLPTTIGDYTPWIAGGIAALLAIYAIA